MKVYIVGIGPGSADYIIPAAKNAIKKADCLIGARRLLGLFKDLQKKEIPVEGHFNDILPYIKKYKDKRRLAVLVSGDPGMCSLSEKISKALRPNEYVIIPGISSLQISFARAGLSWKDAKVLSLHGRKISSLADEIYPHDKVFLFTAWDFPPDKIAARLLREGLENRRAVVCENLSYPDEKIIDTDLRHLTKLKKFSLCTMIVKRKTEKARKSRLYGIGVGPGEPKLLTLKAKEILERADVIFVPKSSSDKASLARSIVEEIIPGKENLVELAFPMTNDTPVLNKYWHRAVRKILREISGGREGAFVTIGDPLIYSTYIYLLKNLKENYPGLEIETVPGIASFNAAASACGVALLEGEEKLAIIPATGNLNDARNALIKFDTVVLMKIGPMLNKVIRLLKELNLLKQSILINRVGHKDERIVYNLASLHDKKIGYLSVIIVKKRRQ